MLACHATHRICGFVPKGACQTLFRGTEASATEKSGLPPPTLTGELSGGMLYPPCIGESSTILPYKRSNPLLGDVDDSHDESKEIEECRRKIT